MIDYIRGTVMVKRVGFAAVEAHGVGYAVSIPLSTYERLPAIGNEALLHIHYHVREDGHKLFGFFTPEERAAFRQLIGVSKIGPKVALNVLSGVSIDDLVRSVHRGDPGRLQKIPGVGAKTAERLVMELKGKLGTASGIPEETSRTGPAGSGASPVRDEVYAAMISLGYHEKQVEKALERVEPLMTGDEPVVTRVGRGSIDGMAGQRR